MKKILRNSIYLLIGIVLFGCTGNFHDDIGISDGSMEKESEEFGRQMADNLRHVVTQMNKNGDDFSDLAKIKTAVVQYTSQYTHTESLSVEGLDNILQRRYQLTPVQRIYMEKIGEAQSLSRTADEFMLSLKKIIKEIQTEAPEIQQRNLLKATVALYYITKEIDLLLKEGLMPVDLNQPQYIRLRSGSEADSYWSALWVGACVIASDIGSAALAVLEGIASAAGYAIVIVGACLLLTADTPINQLSNSDCIDRYSDCVDKGELPSWKCYDCFVYCQGQHVWECPRPY